MFDFRRNHQYFKRKNGNSVYCWKAKDGGYNIAINGASRHIHVKDKQEAKSLLFNLLSI